MNPITLLATTSHPRIDVVLRGLIGLFETTFPGRVRGYYVIGSYADGNPLPTSDLDGVILFKGNFTSTEDCLAQYQAQIHDEWTGLVEAVFERCRAAWHYRIPTSAAERSQLQQICAQTLAFENHFLTVYRDFLLAELQQPEVQGRWLPVHAATTTFAIAEPSLRQQIDQGLTPAKMDEGEEFVWIAQPYRLLAVSMLNKVIYPGDQAILQRLQDLLDSDDIYLKAAAEQAVAAQKNLR